MLEGLNLCLVVLPDVGKRLMDRPLKVGEATRSRSWRGRGNLEEAIERKGRATSEERNGDFDMRES